jgi:hypothetical protein
MPILRGKIREDLSHILFRKYALHVGGTGGVHAEFMKAIHQTEGFGKVKLKPVKNWIMEAKNRECIRVQNTHTHMVANNFCSVKVVCA